MIYAGEVTSEHDSSIDLEAYKKFKEENPDFDLEEDDSEEDNEEESEEMNEESEEAEYGEELVKKTKKE